MKISVQLRGQMLSPPDRYSAHRLDDAHVAGVGMDAFGFGRGVDLDEWIESTEDRDWILSRLNAWEQENALMPGPDSLLLDWEKDLRILGSTPEVRAAIGRCVAAARDFFGSGVKMIGYGLPGPPGPRGSVPMLSLNEVDWVNEAFDAVAAVGYCQSNWLAPDGDVPVLNPEWLQAVAPNAETSLTYAKQFGLPVYWSLWHRMDGIERTDDGEPPNWRDQPFLLDVDPDLSRTWKVQLEAAERHGVHEVLLWNPEDEPELARAIEVAFPTDADETDVIPPDPGEGLEERVRELEMLARDSAKWQQGQMAINENVLDRLSALESAVAKLDDRTPRLGWRGR